MATTKIQFASVEEYLSALTPEQKAHAEKMRSIVKAAAPQASEVISYNIPALKLHGMLLFYAACKDHLGFYAISAALAEHFKKELAPYKKSNKGTVQFPYSLPLPAPLITKMVKYMIRENEQREEARKKKKQPNSRTVELKNKEQGTEE